MNRFAKSYELTCKTCNHKLTISQSDYVDLTLKVLYKAKIMGLGNMEIVRFLNMTAGCCKNPDYKEKVIM